MHQSLECNFLNLLNYKFSALPSRHVTSKFRARARVYFARPTIAIAKIRDYSQSKFMRIASPDLMVN